MYRKLTLASVVLALSTGCVSNPLSFMSSKGESQDPIDTSVVDRSSAEPDQINPDQISESTEESTESAQTSNSEIFAGQCWVQAQIQPKEVRFNAEFVVKESQNKISVTPADVRRGYRQVVTREGVKTYRIEPPVFREVTEQVMVKPELTKFEVIPAVYEEREAVITVEAAKTILEPCKTAGTAFSRGSSAQAFCAREIPARTETVMQQVLVQEEQTQVNFEPAVYETITRRVVETPARAIEITTSEIVETIPVQEVLRQEQTEVTQIPAITKEMQLTEYQGSPQIVARQALCDQDITEDLLLSLQQKLTNNGYNPGPHDGKLGPQTVAALEQYQVDNGLAVGALTLESMKALGLNI